MVVDSVKILEKGVVDFILGWSAIVGRVLRFLIRLLTRERGVR